MPDVRNSLIFTNDAVLDIGGQYATRPRNVFMAGGVFQSYNPGAGLANDATNYERLSLEWFSNAAYIQTAMGGTGVRRELVLRGSAVTLQIGGTTVWQANASGHFVAGADITYDVGASASGRPRDVYVGRDIQMTRNIHWAGTNAVRILGPFSSGVPSDDLIFQTRSGNSQTVVPCMPSGTSKDAAYRVYNNSDPNNSAYIQLVASTTDVGFSSDKTGTGVTLPFRFGMAGVAAMRIETDSTVAVLAGRIRAQSWGATPALGAGLELGYDSAVPISYIFSYDRAGAAYKDLTVAARNITLLATGGKVTLPANTNSQSIQVLGTSTGITYAGSAYADIPEMSVTFTSTGGVVTVWMSVCFSIAGTVGNVTVISLALDGAGEIAQTQTIPAAVNFQVTAVTVWCFGVVAAGTHTVKGRWQQTGAGTTIQAVGTVRRMLVREDKF